MNLQRAVDDGTRDLVEPQVWFWQFGVFGGLAVHQTSSIGATTFAVA